MPRPVRRLVQALAKIADILRELVKREYLPLECVPQRRGRTEIPLEVLDTSRNLGNHGIAVAAYVESVIEVVIAHSKVALHYRLHSA